MFTSLSPWNDKIFLHNRIHRIFFFINKIFLLILRKMWQLSPTSMGNWSSKRKCVFVVAQFNWCPVSWPLNDGEGYIIYSYRDIPCLMALGDLRLSPRCNPRNWIIPVACVQWEFLVRFKLSRIIEVSKIAHGFHATRSLFFFRRW